MRALAAIHQFRLSAQPTGVLLAGAWLAFVVFLSIFGDLIAPTHYETMALQDRLTPPWLFGGKPDYLLGTDHLGRDLVSRLLFGIRVSLAVALIGTLVGAAVGTAVGIVAAHYRGHVDEVVMTLVDFQASVPFMIIVLSVLAFFGNSLVMFVVLIGFQGWETYARISRAMSMSALSLGYTVSARTFGASYLSIYVRHVVPNLMSAIMVQMTLTFPGTILLETSLSFLGLGIQPPMTSLGSMLGEGRDYLTTAWWISVAPGLLIFFTTLSMCLIGDWLRDRLDPTLKR